MTLNPAPDHRTPSMGFARTARLLLLGLMALAGAADAATIEKGDVTTSLQGALFMDDAQTGGTDGTRHDDSAYFEWARTWDVDGDGIPNAAGEPGTITIQGWGFASSASVDANDATSVTVTFRYLGADETQGTADDVLIGSESVLYNYNGAGEYYVNFDTELSAGIDGRGRRFGIWVQPDDLDPLLQESIRFKIAALKFDALTSVKFSASGSFVTPTNAPRLVVAATSPDPDFQFGTVYLPNPGVDEQARTVTYSNAGVSAIDILSIVLTNATGSAVSIDTIPATPLTVDPGDTFSVTLVANGSDGTEGTPFSADLAFETDWAENALFNYDRSEPVSAAIYGAGDPYTINSNPLLDTGLGGWSTGAGGAAVTGIVAGSTGAARVKGEGDPDNAAATDSFGQTLPAGFEDLTITFWTALADYYTPVGSFADRSFQYVVFADGDIPNSAAGMDDSHVDSAMINLGYFPDGVPGTTGSGNAGWYLFNGTSWIGVPGLPTVAFSTDSGNDGALDGADTVNAHRVTLTTRDFGTPGASYDITVSSANSTNPAGTATGLTTFHSVDITTATPGGHTFTAGDVSATSGNSALIGSFWVDEIRVGAGAGLPVAILDRVNVPDGVNAEEGAASSPPANLILANAGIGTNLNVSISLPEPEFSLVGINAGVTSIGFGESVTYEISLDATALTAEAVVPGTLIVTTDSLIAPSFTNQLLGYVYEPGSPLFNGSFELQGSTAPNVLDDFARWNQFNNTNAYPVPAIAPTGTRAVHLLADVNSTDQAVNGRLRQALRYEAKSFEVEGYFAVKQNNNNGREFTILFTGLGDDSGVTLRHQTSVNGWSAFSSTWVPILPNATLLPSDDGGDGELNPGDTINLYRLRLVGRNWDDPGIADYDIEIYDGSNTLLDSVTTNVFRNNNPVPLGRIDFNPAFGGCPGYWVDNWSMSNVVPLASAPTAITFFGVGAAGATSVRFVDTGAPAFVVDLAADPAGLGAGTSIEVSPGNGTLDESSVPGEIQFDFADPAPGPRRTLRIRSN